jgi:hypothetical protein
MIATGKTRMRVFSIYTDSTKRLADEWFLPSIKDNWEICIKYLPEYKDEGNYLSPQWYKVIQEKITMLMEEIKKNIGDVILWIDIDFQFFRECTPEISRAIRDKDIVFQIWDRKKRQVNTGFMAIRCNNHSLSFFERISSIDYSTFQFADQDAANQLLEDCKDLRWGFISPNVFSVNMGEPPLNIVAHHACATPNKIQCLNRIKEVVSKPILVRIARLLMHRIKRIGRWHLSLLRVMTKKYLSWDIQPFIE